MWFNLVISSIRENHFLRAQERPATLILTLTSGLHITHARQDYNRDTETGSWNFVVPLRTIRMRKMCQSQQFATWAWDTGCRLLSHGRSKCRTKRLSKLLLLRLKLSAEKIKNPAVVKNVFFFLLELEVGTYINLYSFESSMKWDQVTFCKISDYAEQAEQKSLHKPWHRS